MGRHGRAVFPHVLIGFKVKVERHVDPSLEGVEGTVVVETRNTLLILTRGRGLVRVLKEHGVFTVELEGGEYIRIPGRELNGNPVERVKEYRWRVSGRCRSSKA